MLISIKSLGYSKCYSLRNSRPIKNPSNSIRYSCQRIYIWMRRLKISLEIRKKATFLEVIKNLLCTSFSNILLTAKRRPKGLQFLAIDLLYCSWIQIHLNTYWKDQLICILVQVHNSSEPPLECHQDETFL